MDAFAVLMLLCKDGRTPAILDEVLERLFKRRQSRKEATATAFFFASQVFKTPEDLEALQRRYTMIEEELKDNWFYNHVLEEGLAKGTAKGFEQGIERGVERGIEQSIELFVEKRFPNALAWVKERVERISDPRVLQELMADLFVVNSEEEIRAAFAVQR